MNVIVGASSCFALAGILIGIGALVVFRQPLLALRVTADLFVAAGLLRLSVDLSWAAITGTVAVIAVRHLLTRSLASDFNAAPHGARA
ncbi:hypothetical protein NGTWS0302_24900 [Mycolicibacterium cyprinidarum]|uniref:DUF1622 domain-containing protein n=1 Tax=Mycolicibacterium cyprinidarum TaxID=2860311 RepID=A0ABQ4VBV6_9MYCO|nr:hypothetical protein NGTWS0302_24900 [Mycolicibacterium sp. NGTWS0302]GJF17409.1 hypothetical protein NGTWS1702_23790 [Mycolicibacterium sp. NGTWSNA01]GJF18477.1 hypothetical protein NGTWS1803_07660 [Mycolicibacterium sp. NGTWS1803]